VLVGRRCHQDREHRRESMELISRFRFHRRSWCLWRSWDWPVTAVWQQDDSGVKVVPTPQSFFN